MEADLRLVAGPEKDFVLVFLVRQDSRHCSFSQNDNGLESTARVPFSTNRLILLRNIAEQLLPVDYEIEKSVNK